MLETLFLGSIASLFIAALLPLLPSSGRRTRTASFAVVAIGAALMFFMSADIVFGGQKIVIEPYWVSPAFSLSFSVDRLSAFFLVLISGVSFAVALYSIDYVEQLEHEGRKNLVCALMALFILSMAFVVASSNTYSFLFFWELMSVSSLFLVLTEYEHEDVRKAGLFYFIMTQLGAVFLFAAFILLYDAGGTFDIAHVALTPMTLNVVIACLFIGFGMKAGIIPFHKWLPYAHPASPSNISALMSGVMLKVALYGLFRFMLYVVEPTLQWGIVVIVFGTVSAILGVIYALKEHDIKRLLAYHSIENVGIILIGFGASMIFASYGLKSLATLALIGALFHSLNHAIFKSLLFLTAGAVVNATKSRNIEELGGLIKRMPYTSVLFLVGAVSISGMPPFNGFVSELMIFQALMQSYMVGDPLVEMLLVICLAIFAMTSALAAACFVKAFGVTFLAVPRSENARKADESGKYMIWGSAVLASACVFLGIFSGRLIDAAGYGLPIVDMFTVGAVLIVTYALICLIIYYATSRKSRVSETWGCGLESLDCRMEYTASGFSEPVMRIFKPIYRTREEGEMMFYDRFGSIFKEGHAEIHLMKFFEDYMYLPVANAVDSLAERVSRLQNGHLDSYLLYAFITVLALLVLVGWFV